MCFVGLWVDDERPIPSDLIGWTSARSFHEAITKLDLLEFEEVSLDHDLASFYGKREMTGYDILLWLIQRQYDGHYVPQKIHIHTANCVARPKMIKMVERYF